MSDSAAESLGKYKGFLSLDGLTSLSAAAVKSLKSNQLASFPTDFSPAAREKREKMNAAVARAATATEISDTALRNTGIVVIALCLIGVIGLYQLRDASVPSPSEQYRSQFPTDEVRREYETWRREGEDPDEGIRKGFLVEWPEKPKGFIETEVRDR